LAINCELLKKDWLTTDLCHEIIELYSSAHKKDPETDKRDQAAFVAKDRYTISPRMYICQFLAAWSVGKVTLSCVSYIEGPWSK
jgi:hypothetical protein